MGKHVDEVHEGEKRDIHFGMKVLEIFKNDPLARQVMEGVKLKEIRADHILNSKDEFHQPGEIIPEWQGKKKKSSKSYPNDSKNRQENTDNVENTRKNHQKNGKVTQLRNTGVKTRSMAKLEKSRGNVMQS